MHKIKTLITVFTTVMLICALSVTFAWYVSTVNVNGSIDLRADKALEVSLGALTEKIGEKYNGQLGYDAEGNVYTAQNSPDPDNPDSPYYAWADLTLHPKGGDAVAATFEISQAVVTLDRQYYYYNWLTTVHRLFDPAATSDDRDKWVGTYEPQASFIRAGDAGYYAADETGAFKELSNGDKVERFVAPQKMDADQKGFVVNTKGGSMVSHIVLTGAHIAEFFYLEYARYDGDALLPQRYAPDVQLPLCDPIAPAVKADAKIRLYIGYFGTLDPTLPRENQTHGTFAFSDTHFRGTRFTFRVRVKGDVWEGLPSA